MVQGVAISALVAVLAASFEAVNAAQPVWAQCGVRSNTVETIPSANAILPPIGYLLDW